MDVDALLALAIVVPICILAIPFILRGLRRGRQLTEERVDAWAKQHDLRLLSKADSFFGGPFWSWTEVFWSRSGPVYRIVVEDRDGNRRIGHLRLGGSLLDPDSPPEEVEVRWDD